MIISIASGKGGTGKTTVAVNLALVLSNSQLLDCDVEEPNAALFVSPLVTNREKAYILTPEVNREICNYCGICRDVCEYNAIAVLNSSAEKSGNIMIFPQLCHGCGACQYLCPKNAIKEIRREIGSIEIGTAGDLQFVQGRLNIGEAIAPPVIRQVKKHIDPTRTVILDAPPGTSCPVIAAVEGSDFCVLVTEPTPFGLNDLELAVDTMRKLKIPFGVVLNRCDIGDRAVEAFCKKNSIPILMRIPFSEDIARSYSEGTPIVNKYPEYKNKFINLFDSIRRFLNGN